MQISVLGALVLAAALALAGGPARAGDVHEYVVAADDGYGLEDCLASGSDCGQVVADAWCEAHGRGHAVSFGPRDATGARATRVTASDEPYVIRCGD